MAIHAVIFDLGGVLLEIDWEKGRIALQADRYYLELAMQEAELAAHEGTFPIGAVLVAPAGQIVSRGRNRVYSSGDYTAHAEIEVIRQAGGLLMAPTYKRSCTLQILATRRGW